MRGWLAFLGEASEADGLHPSEVPELLISSKPCRHVYSISLQGTEEDWIELEGMSCIKGQSLGVWD